MKSLHIRRFSMSSYLYKIKITNAKSHSSHQWLERQIKDPYVERAKIENYRCRSAFKLLELNEKLNLFKKGNCVIDCGAAPGSWTQVAVNKTNADGKEPNKSIGFVVSIDKLHIYPINGAHILGNMDFTNVVTQTKILKMLNGRKVDIVLSDMAPNATGVKELDQYNIVELCDSVLKFTLNLIKLNQTNNSNLMELNKLNQIENNSLGKVNSSAPCLLVKIWDSDHSKKFENHLKSYFNVVKYLKPNASRTNSAEKYLFAKNFKNN